MPIQDKLENDLKEAIKQKDALRLSVLRMALAAIHNQSIAKRSKGGRSELSDEEVLAVLSGERKKRKEAIAEFERGGRSDLSKKEVSEMEILEKYLPAQLSQGEIEKIVKEVVRALDSPGISEFGSIMAAVMKQMNGRAEGEAVARLVRQTLQSHAKR